MRNRWNIIVLLSFVLCASALGLWFITANSTLFQGSNRLANREERSTLTNNAESRTAPTSGKPSLTLQAAASIQEERKHLDQTVWEKEVLAQHYEDTFVKLWDDLRNEEDEFAVLADFPFEQLSLRETGSTERIVGEISMSGLDGPPLILTHEQWKTQLRDMKLQGFRLDQSEWHHEAFDHDPDGTARSVVSIVLHISADQPERKLSVKGKLKVAWNPEPDTEGSYVPRRIALEDATLMQRTGSSVFRIRGKIRKFGSIHPVLLYDLNLDGNLDIVLAGINSVLWNRGRGKFEEEDLCAHPEIDISAALLADFTGDGMADFICAGEDAYPVLYSGASEGKFPAKGKQVMATGLPLDAPLAITAGDVDGDGHLDVWLSQYKSAYMGGQMPTPYFDANDGYPSYLLLGDGQGGFRDATEDAGLDKKRFRRTYSNSFVDLDDDGDLDLLVVSDFSGIDLYHNDGKGHFTDVTESVVDLRANFGMSHTFGDYNLDGDLDFYVVGMSSTTARRLDHLGLGRDDFPEYQTMRMGMAYGNRMYLAQPDHTYREPSFGEQVARTGWSWGSTSFDFDNDGDLDIYVANGHLSRETAKDYCTHFWCHDIYSGTSVEDRGLHEFFGQNAILMKKQGISWNGYEHNHLFVNESGGQFVNGAFLMDAAFEFDARGVVSGDLDNDGRIDLLVVKVDESDPAMGGRASDELYVLNNDWPIPRPWIGVDLAPAPGRSPIGARITVRYPSGEQTARIVTGDSFRAQHPCRKHFGLGEVSHVDMIEVKWFDGTVHQLKNPAVNQYHRTP